MPQYVAGHRRLGPVKAATTPSTTPVRSQTAVRESGYVVAGGATTASWWGWNEQREDTPELRWPESIKVFDRMRRQDAQVSSVLRAVTHPVRRTKWRVDPAGARPEVVDHVSQDLGLPVLGSDDVPTLRTRDRFSWSAHLRLALLSLPFGHMVFEQVYRIDDTTGLARLRKLGPRMPETITKWNVARDGGLVSVEQGTVGAGSGNITLPVSRLVVYVNEREGGEWWGQSLLRAAYKNWIIKDRLLRTQAQAIDRNGMGLPVYTGAAGAPQEDVDAGAELAQRVRAGDNSGLGLPSGAKMELLGVQGQVPDAKPAVEYHDSQIAAAVLAQFLNLGKQTGSWALGSVFADTFVESLQAVAQEIADTATQHVVEDIVDINYGPDELAPRIVFDEIGSQTAQIAAALKMLVDAGVLTPDPGLESYIRTGLGLPAGDA